MLTGLFAPDAGDASILGHSIRTQMQDVRRQLGVCPQQDILFPDLTVEEHLSMFAAFKGVPQESIAKEVESMIQSVGLTEKRHAYSKTLSGGQKRKLCVGIAFIGGSKVVLLDGTQSPFPAVVCVVSGVIRTYVWYGSLLPTLHVECDSSTQGGTRGDSHHSFHGACSFISFYQPPLRTMVYVGRS